MRRLVLMPVVITAFAMAGCGSGKQATTSVVHRVITATPASPIPHLPQSVPQKGSGEADPGSVRIIKAWLAALRNGNIARAAAYFAQPSTVQNGTPVLRLTTRIARVEWNAAFPCGAKATRLRAGPRGFTIVDFELTERRNGDCQGAAGSPARGAIRVEGRRIKEWYRLPDSETQDNTPASPGVDAGPGLA